MHLFHTIAKISLINQVFLRVFGFLSANSAAFFCRRNLEVKVCILSLSLLNKICNLQFLSLCQCLSRFLRPRLSRSLCSRLSGSTFLHLARSFCPLFRCVCLSPSRNLSSYPSRFLCPSLSRSLCPPFYFSPVLSLSNLLTAS